MKPSDARPSRHPPAETWEHMNTTTGSQRDSSDSKREGSSGRLLFSAPYAAVLAASLAVAGCTNSSSAKHAAPAPAATSAGSAAPQGSAASLVPAADRGKTLDLGLELGNLPLADYTADRSSFTGLDYDLVQAMAPLLGVKVAYHGTNFNSLIPGVSSGKFAFAMSGIFDTATREKVVDEVTYMADSSVVITRKGGKTDLTENTLCGLRVSVEASSTQAADIPVRSAKCQAEGKEPIQLQIYTDQGQQYLAVTSGRADVINTPTSNGDYLIKTRPNDFQQAGPTYSSIPIAIVLQKGSGLTQAVQAAVNTLMANGSYAQILKKWGLSNAAIARSEVNMQSGK